MLSGAAVAFAFRFIMNAPNYTKAGLGDLLQSPTSLWHDYVVYSVLTAVFMAVVLPAIIHDFSGYGWIAAIAMAVWVFGAVADATIHPLDPRNLHPPVQETILRR